MARFLVLGNKFIDVDRVEDSYILENPLNESKELTIRFINGDSYVRISVDNSITILTVAKIIAYVRGMEENSCITWSEVLLQLKVKDNARR